MKKVNFLITILLLLVSFTIACTEQQQSTTPVSSDKPQYGGTLIIGGRGGPVNIGMPGQIGSPSDLACIIPAVEYFLKIDEAGLPIPWLATGWEVGKDNKSITFTLRKGVKFHDGTDFNAEAAKYVFDIIRTSTFQDLKAVTSIDVVDDYTMRFNLTSFQSSILYSLGARAGWIISPTAIKTYGKDWCLTHPVGTGPFKFVSFQRDVSLKYAKFESYWQKDKPYLDAIEFKFIPDNTTRLMSFLAGEVHVAAGISPKDANDLAKGGKYKITKNASYVNSFISDSKRAESPFNKLKVRQAISYAIDSTALNTAIGYGLHEVTNQPVDPSHFAYNKNVKGYPYDPLKAKELLAQAGYPEGFTAKIIFNTGTADPSFNPAIQNFLKAVGIKGELDPRENTNFVQTTSKGWEGLIGHETQSSTDSDIGQAFLQRLTGKAPRWAASVDYSPTYESKLEQCIAEPDNTKRKALYQELMKIIIDDYCMINPIFNVYSFSAKNLQVQNDKYGDKFLYLWTPQDAWLKK